MESPTRLYFKASPPIVAFPSAKLFLASVWQPCLAYNGMLKKDVLGAVYSNVGGAPD
jgi:hypothetical protein